jgi:hypothetical protein
MGEQKRGFASAFILATLFIIIAGLGIYFLVTKSGGSSLVMSPISIPATPYVSPSVSPLSSVTNDCAPVLYPKLTWSTPASGSYVFLSSTGSDDVTLPGFAVTADLPKPSSEEEDAFFSFYKSGLEAGGWVEAGLATAPTTLGITRSYKKGQQWLLLQYSGEAVSQLNKASIQWNSWCPHP